MMIDPLFPTFLYGFDVPNHKELNQDLEKNILSWSKNNKGIKRTNINGWHSETNMHEKPEYKNILELLFRAQADIYKHEALDRKAKIGNMWANINYKEGYNVEHIHPNSLFSGVYYVKAKLGSGHLIVKDPRPGANIQRGVLNPNVEEPIYVKKGHSCEPKEGRIIMFPAWLSHLVEENKSGQDRISISFNFIQEGF